MVFHGCLNGRDSERKFIQHQFDMDRFPRLWSAKSLNKPEFRIKCRGPRKVARVEIDHVRFKGRHHCPSIIIQPSVPIGPRRRFVGIPALTGLSALRQPVTRPRRTRPSTPSPTVSIIHVPGSGTVLWLVETSNVGP